MRYLIADISANGETAPNGETSAPEVVDAAQALSTEVIATVDPEFLTGADIATALPEIRQGGDLFDLIVTAGPDYIAGFRGHYTCEGGQ